MLSERDPRPDHTEWPCALAGMLAVFAECERDILRDRVKAGIAQARKEGRPHGRPVTAGLHLQKVKDLFSGGMSKREIAKQVGISRTSVRRLLVPARIVLRAESDAFVSAACARARKARAKTFVERLLYDSGSRRISGRSCGT
jgi:DNA invertase Pin-like site-specific DNA recombinase